jgi:hypothetical protein
VLEGSRGIFYRKCLKPTKLLLLGCTYETLDLLIEHQGFYNQYIWQWMKPFWSKLLIFQHGFQKMNSHETLRDISSLNSLGNANCQNVLNRNLLVANVSMSILWYHIGYQLILLKRPHPKEHVLPWHCDVISKWLLIWH